MSGQKKRIACIILAAGMAVRFKSVKQLVKFERKSLVQRALDTANKSLADYVILIVGAHASEILSEINLGRAEVVLNKNFAKGQSTSVKCGISNLPDDCSGAIMMVADQPFLKTIYLDRMIRTFRRGKNAEAVVLSHYGEPRNPVLLPRRLFPKLLKLRGDVGARATIKNYDSVRLIEISDEKAFFDIDTKREASKLKSFERAK